MKEEQGWIYEYRHISSGGFLLLLLLCSFSRTPTFGFSLYQVLGSKVALGILLYFITEVLTIVSES